MSVLNSASNGLPSLLIILFRYVHREGNVSRHELIEACFPGIPATLTVKETDSKLRQTLNTWVELGFFDADGDDVISLSANVKAFLKGVKDVDSATRLLPSIARSTLFRRENRQRLWEAERNKAGDLCKLLGWLSVQDVWTMEISSHVEAKLLEDEQLEQRGDIEFIRNKDRWPGFKAWSAFLDVARSSSEGAIHIDLTSAVRAALPRVFPGRGSKMTIGQFMEALAIEIPFIDGGEVWTEVTGKLRADRWKRPAETELSTVSSMFLLRLQHEGAISMDALDDTSRRVLLGAGNVPLGRAVSHVTVNGGGK